MELWIQEKPINNKRNQAIKGEDWTGIFQSLAGKRKYQYFVVSNELFTSYHADTLRPSAD